MENNLKMTSGIPGKMTSGIHGRMTSGIHGKMTSRIPGCFILPENPNMMPVKFQNDEILREIEISHFDLLLKMDEFQTQFKKEIPQLPVTYSEFLSYQCLMNRAFQFKLIDQIWIIKELDYRFLILADYLRDQRFSELLYFYSRNLLSGSIQIPDPLPQDYTKIFFHLENRTYTPAQLARLLEQKPVRNQWSQLYPYFPVRPMLDLDWKIPLLSVSYGIENFHLPEENFSWSDLSEIKFKYLHWALTQGLVQVVRYLVQVNFLTLETLQADQYEALRLAVSSAQLKVVDYLRMEFKLSREDAQAAQLLISAAQSGQVEVLEDLYKSWSYPVETSHFRLEINSALEVAATGGHLAMVKRLMERSQFVADPFDPNFFELDREILIKAAQKGHLEILKYLVSTIGTNKLMSLEDPRFQVEDSLDKYAKLENVTTTAAIFGHLEMLEYLVSVLQLDIRPDDFLRNPRTLNPLIVRVIKESGHLGVIRFLLERNTCWCIPVFDKTFLLGPERENLVKAVEYGRIHILDYLRQKLRLDDQDLRFNSNELLRKAAARGQLEVIKYLGHFFNLTSQDVRSQDNEALRLAVIFNHSETAKYLITEFGLNLSDLRARNNEILRSVMGSNQLELVQYLTSQFDFSLRDLRRSAVEVLITILVRKHQAILDYLRREELITIEDLRVSHYFVMREVVERNPFSLKYVVETFGLTRLGVHDDIGPWIGQALHEAIGRGIWKVVTYLTQDLGLKVEEARTVRTLIAALKTNSREWAQYVIDQFGFQADHFRASPLLKTACDSRYNEDLLIYLIQRFQLKPEELQTYSIFNHLGWKPKLLDYLIDHFGLKATHLDFFYLDKTLYDLIRLDLPPHRIRSYIERLEVKPSNLFLTSNYLLISLIKCNYSEWRELADYLIEHFKIQAKFLYQIDKSADVMEQALFYERLDLIDYLSDKFYFEGVNHRRWAQPALKLARSENNQELIKKLKLILNR